MSGLMHQPPSVDQINDVDFDNLQMINYCNEVERVLS